VTYNGEVVLKGCFPPAERKIEREVLLLALRLAEIMVVQLGPWSHVLQLDLRPTQRSDEPQARARSKLA
jgi:hypothetical protein